MAKGKPRDCKQGNFPLFISADCANMEDTPELEINWFLLLLILGIVLLTKLLRAGKSTICNKVCILSFTEKHS